MSLNPLNPQRLKRFSAAEALHAERERRAHARSHRHETLFVQAAIAREDGEVRQTLRCQSADLSRGGLRITLAAAIDPGTVLEVWIKVPDAGRNFYLVGTVRWCECVAGNALIGVAVRDAPGTDYKLWRRMNFGVVPHAPVRCLE